MFLRLTDWIWQIVTRIRPGGGMEVWKIGNWKDCGRSIEDGKILKDKNGDVVL